MSNPMPNRPPQRKWQLGALGVVAAAAVIGWLADSASAQAPAAWQNLARDAGRFEEDLDEMLLDSPNWLVSGGENARAVYLDGTGLVVSFDASLVGSRWTTGSNNWSWSGFRIKHRGDNWNVYEDDDDDDDWDDDRADNDDKDNDKDKKERDRDRDRSSRTRSGREQRNFERGKEELVDFLTDFGPDLDQLRAGESVILVGCLDDSRYLHREKVSRLVVRVSAEDLKARASGGLSNDALRAKIVQEQY